MGEEMGSMSDCIFLDSKITADGDCSHKIKRCLLLGRKAITNLDSILKSRDITLLTKVCIAKDMVFPVVIYRCESWTIKKVACQRTDVLNCGAGEDSWEFLWNQGNQTSKSKRHQPWIFIGRTDVNAPILWPPDVQCWFIGKDPDAGKDWRQEEKRKKEEEMVGCITESMDMGLSKIR